MNRYKPYEHLRHKSYDKKYDYKSISDAYYETCQDCERPTYKKTETAIGCWMMLATLWTQTAWKKQFF